MNHVSIVRRYMSRCFSDASQVSLENWVLTMALLYWCCVLTVVAVSRIMSHHYSLLRGFVLSLMFKKQGIKTLLTPLTYFTLARLLFVDKNVKNFQFKALYPQTYICYNNIADLVSVFNNFKSALISIFLLNGAFSWTNYYQPRLLLNVSHLVGSMYLMGGCRATNHSAQFWVTCG